MTGTPDGVPPAAWRITSASRKGSSHGESTPNQDAVRCVSLSQGSNGTVCVVAVSDGHGGARYVRSDVGSQLAVDVTVDRLSEVLASSSSLPAADLLRQEVGTFVERWRAEVDAHYRANPFTEEETRRAGVPSLDEEPQLAYGATLLVAIVGDSGVGIAQIGDGDALIRTHGFATRPVPGDLRLTGGQTTSLCLDSAPQDFRFAGLPATADPDLVLLSTDGYANSFADPDWWQGLVGDVAWFLQTEGFDELETQLPEWLGESAQVGGDDVTAAVVVRDPLAVPATREVVPARPAPERPPVGVVPVQELVRGRTLNLPEETERVGPVEPVDQGHRNRIALLATGAVLAVVAVVAALMLLLGGEDDEPPGGPEDTRTPGASVSETPTPRRPRASRTPSRSATPTLRPPGPTAPTLPSRSGGTGSAP